MKRSEINAALREMEAMLRKHCVSLPDFCGFTPEDWLSKGHEWDEVRDNMLGWDITDYGLGRFDEVGFSLITLRNGNHAMPQVYPKTYAEKLLYLKDGQYAPMHFHWSTAPTKARRSTGKAPSPSASTGRRAPYPPGRRSACGPGRASRSSPFCITISVWSPAAGRCCSARSASATTTAATTVSPRRWAASRRSKRMRCRIVFCATSIRRQNDPGTAEPSPRRKTV